MIWLSNLRRNVEGGKMRIITAYFGHLSNILRPTEQRRAVNTALRCQAFLLTIGKQHVLRRRKIPRPRKTVAFTALVVLGYNVLESLYTRTPIYGVW